MTFNIKKYSRNFFVSNALAVAFWAGGLVRPKSKKDDLRKMDFPTSTQKIGLSFTEKIRCKFRSRWIKKHPG